MKRNLIDDYKRRSMRKLQIGLLLIALLLPPIKANQINEKVHIEKFEEIFSKTKSDVNKSKEFHTYLNSLTNEELINALKGISAIKDADQKQKTDFVAYTLIAPISKKFKDKEFRTLISKELIKKETNPALILVSLELLEKNIKKANNKQEIENFDSILLELVKNSELPGYLRKKAASEVGSTQDHVYNKKTIFSLLKTDNKSVVNGASLSLKKYLSSDISDSEKTEIIHNLLSVVQGKNNLKEFKNVIYTLGYSKHQLAKDYLLRLLKSEDNEDTELQDMLIRSLKSFNDKEVVKAIFNSFRVEGKLLSFGSELLLGSVINEHPKLLIEMKSLKSEDDKIVFLQAVRYMRKDNKIYKNDVKSLLYDNSPEVRLEAVKSFRFIASLKEEQIIFKQMLDKEINSQINELLNFYIGE